MSDDGNYPVDDATRAELRDATTEYTYKSFDAYWTNKRESDSREFARQVVEAYNERRKEKL